MDTKLQQVELGQPSEEPNNPVDVVEPYYLTNIRSVDERLKPGLVGNEFEEDISVSGENRIHPKSQKKWVRKIRILDFGGIDEAS